MLYQLSYALRPHFQVSTFGGGNSSLKCSFRIWYAALRLGGSGVGGTAERSWIAEESAARLRLGGRLAEEDDCAVSK
jgi:hypothetical protein